MDRTAAAEGAALWLMHLRRRKRPVSPVMCGMSNAAAGGRACNALPLHCPRWWLLSCRNMYSGNCML